MAGCDSGISTVEEEHFAGFSGESDADIAFPDFSENAAEMMETEGVETEAISEEENAELTSGGCILDDDCATPEGIDPCSKVVCIDHTCLIEPLSDGTTCTSEETEFNLCILTSVCDKGSCVAIEEVQCEASEQCETVSCEPSTGNCTSTAIPGCELKPSCITDTDCIGELDLLPCERGLCIEGFCELGGNAPDGSMCFQDEWEDQPCIIGGKCDEGSCAPIVPNCDDSDPCTIDSCQSSLGGCVSVLDPEACGAERNSPVGTPCDEGTLCESGICDGDICISTCLDGSTCSNDTYCDFDGWCIPLIAMGEACEEDGQCITGACEGSLVSDKTCVCLDHTHCSEHEYCATFGVNECTPVIDICDDICSTDKSCGTEAICAGAPVGQCVIGGASIVGQLCCRDAQCASGVCASDGVCQCAEDSDCPSGVCDTSLFGANVCVECIHHDDCDEGLFCAVDTCVSKFPVGLACNKDDECISDICGSNGVCQCASSLDCGDDLVCSTALFGANLCVQCETDAHCGDGAYCDVDICRDQLIVGETCHSDVACLSDLCGSNDQCQCKEDHHCGPGMMCSTALFGANHCVECEGHADCNAGSYCSDGMCLNQSIVGEVCSEDIQCLSDICEGSEPSTCTCGNDSDCGDNMVCDTSVFGMNTCVQCMNHSHCGTDSFCHDGACVDQGPVGFPCTKDDHCLSDSCQGDTFGEGNCACLDDPDCGDDLICDTNIFSPNECVIP